MEYQFRWLQTGYNIGLFPIKKVLQVRYRPHIKLPEEIEVGWSEWQDVPVEEEDAKTQGHSPV